MILPLLSRPESPAASDLVSKKATAKNPTKLVRTGDAALLEEPNVLPTSGIKRTS